MGSFLSSIDVRGYNNKLTYICAPVSALHGMRSGLEQELFQAQYYQIKSWGGGLHIKVIAKNNNVA